MSRNYASNPCATDSDLGRDKNPRKKPAKIQLSMDSGGLGRNEFDPDRNSSVRKNHGNKKGQGPPPFKFIPTGCNYSSFPTVFVCA